MVTNPLNFGATKVLEAASPETTHQIRDAGIDYLKGGPLLGPLAVLSGFFERSANPPVSIEAPAQEGAAISPALSGSDGIASGARGVGAARSTRVC